MKKMDRFEIIYDLRSHFDRDYDYVELVDWVGNHLELINEDEKISRLSDPLKILNYGRGGSREFSILYVAVCIAHGYDARLVVGRSSADKVWAEVKNLDDWTHVDPFEAIIDQPYHYEAYGKTMENVFAFGTNYQENVTSRYFSFEWCSARGESCLVR